MINFPQEKPLVLDMEFSMDSFAVDSLLYSFPLPPPWTRLNDGRFLNEITLEISSNHPLSILRDSIFHDVSPSNNIEKPKLASQPMEENNNLASLEISNIDPNLSFLNFSQGFVSKYTHRGDGVEFRCSWKEINPNGTKYGFVLILKFFDDQSFEIRFDGVDGCWQMPKLVGPYGPLDRHDLFIGAKIKVFGRHLTITSASAATCREIDEEGERLARKQEWLRRKVESVGAIPVVKRPPPSQNNSFSRGSKTSGSCNLRKLVQENNKLGEQLSHLGMSHILTNVKGTFRDDDIYLRKSSYFIETGLHSSVYKTERDVSFK